MFQYLDLQWNIAMIYDVILKFKYPFQRNILKNSLREVSIFIIPLSKIRKPIHIILESLLHCTNPYFLGLFSLDSLILSEFE